MNQPLKRIEKRDLSGGVQTRTVVPLSLNSQVIHALNGEFSTKLGAVTGRKGSTVQSTVVAAQRVLTILQWIKNDGTVKYLAAVDDGAGTPKVDLYVNSAVFAGTWAKSQEDLTTVTDVFGVNFINKLITANGVDAVKGFDGSSWAAITNAPAAGKFPEVFQQRLFLLTETGYLHYSDTINSAGTDFTTTTWLYRGINPNDGQKAKMLKRHRGRLVILKEESIYRYDGSNEPEAVITVGTHSGKSVVILNDLYFHHPTGIYKMGVGEPVMISRSMQKYLDGMSSANWSQVAAGRDLEHVYFWIGDVTIADPLEHDYGKTYTDMVLVYNVYAETWTAFTNWNARSWFYDETSGLTYFGTAAGKIVRINLNYADIDDTTTTPINFELIFMPENYGYPEKYKEFNQIYVLGKYQSDVLAGDSYDSMTGKEQLENSQGLINEKITAKELWLGVSESYVDTPPRIEGYILDKCNLLDDAK